VAGPNLIPLGGGEVVGDSPDRRVEILSDHDSLHATWSRFGPGRDGADLHVHHHHTDLFYVLEGELTLRLSLEDEPVAVPAGTLARVPPMVVHGFRNGSDADVRYLNFHAPGQGFANFMRGLRDGRPVTYDQHPPPADGGRPATEAVIGGEANVGAIAISEVRSRAGGPSPAPQMHERHVGSFYVLEGEVTLTTDGRELRAEEGSWVQVPACVRHTISFTGPHPTRFLSLLSPL
jgi:mannose-6-phosphate isomerase-like protein (cupin superfamily)